VLDLTANYVTKEDPLFKQAETDSDAKTAFVIKTTPTNWKKVKGQGSAWKEERRSYYLSQFDDHFDLQMSSTVAQNKLIEVLKFLVDLGVKGFRLENAKHFVINTNFADETHNIANHGNMEDYDFYTHSQTQFVAGLGAVIQTLSKAVYNATNGEGFLTITDDVTDRFDAFLVSNSSNLPFDLPRFEFINGPFHKHGNRSIAQSIYETFKTLDSKGIDMQNLWLQLTYKRSNFDQENGLSASAYNSFMLLLPGVPIVSLDTLNYDNNKTETIKKLEEARNSNVFEHGKFDVYISNDNNIFAYTR